MCLLTRALRAFMEITGFRYLSVCAGEVHVLLLIADVSNSNIKILERRLLAPTAVPIAGLVNDATYTKHVDAVLRNSHSFGFADEVLDYAS